MNLIKISVVFVLCFSILFVFQIGCDGETEDDITKPGRYSRSIIFDDLERNYDVCIPQGYNGTSPLPLLFDIHGLAMGPTMMEDMTHFCKKANEEGIIVVQPDGISNSWNAGWCCGSAASDELDDVGLMRAIRDDLSDELNIDLKRVYADGLSNGGMISNRIACEDTDLVAAIAPVVGGISFGTQSDVDYDQCQPTRPVPVLMISGADDPLISFESQAATFERWLNLNGCNRLSASIEQSGVFTCTTYDDCDGGVETIHCVGEGVGHCWPGTDYALYGCIDDLNATNYIWDFLKKYSIP